MSRRSAAAVACVLCLAVTGAGQAPPAGAAAPARGAAKADPLPELLRKLSSEPGPTSNQIPDITAVPLVELAATVSKRHDIPVVIRDGGDATTSERKPQLPPGTRLDGLSLRSYLTVVLRACGMVPLVRKDRLEFVPVDQAARETDSRVRENELTQPLVSAVVQEKPLNEVLAAVAEEFDLTVVVSAQAGDNRTGFVTARLLNVPADRALELLAVQADLRVVKRGNAFLVTSRDHATALADEALEEERRKAETKQLRKNGPPPPQPQPEPPPAKPGM